MDPIGIYYELSYDSLWIMKCFELSWCLKTYCVSLGVFQGGMIIHLNPDGSRLFNQRIRRHRRSKHQAQLHDQISMWWLANVAIRIWFLAQQWMTPVSRCVHLCAMFVMDGEGISAGRGWQWHLVAVFESAVVAQMIVFLHEATKTATKSHLQNHIHCLVPIFLQQMKVSPP